MNAHNYATTLLICAGFLLADVAIAGPRLDEVSFIAVHNAYAEDIPPSTQIVSYNVWEVEIDFGQQASGRPLEVGHFGAGDDTTNHGFGYGLVDWLANIRQGLEAIDHPVLIKLEANTSCNRTGCCFSGIWGWRCDVSNWDAGWQDELRSTAEQVFGPTILRPREFFETHNGQWPELEHLGGRVILSLQTRHKDDDAFIDELGYDRDADTAFFIRLHSEGEEWGDNRSFPDLSDASGNSPREIANALKARKNRLILDYVFDQEWTHVGTHPPVPLHVKPTSTMRWGTSAFPHISVGQALQAGWVVPVLPSGPLDGDAYEGHRSYTELAIQAGTYPERITFSRPATLTAAGGSVTIGGNQVAYTVYVQVPESPSDGWTDGEVTVTVSGDNGSFTSVFSGGEGRENGFVNPGVRRQFATNGDIGVIRSARIANPGHAGYFECIYVDSGTTGRYYIPVHEWVEPTVTKLVAAHWD